MIAFLQEWQANSTLEALSYQRKISLRLVEIFVEWKKKIYQKCMLFTQIKTKRVIKSTMPTPKKSSGTWSNPVIK